MAQAITLTLNDEEAGLVLRAVKNTRELMIAGRDFRDEDDCKVLQRVEIMLDAHIRAAGV